MQTEIPAVLEQALTNYLRFVTRGDVSAERTDAHEEVLWQMRLCGIPFADRDDAREIAIRWMQTGEIMPQRLLTQAEYESLQAQYAATPDPAEGFTSTGQHFILLALLGRMGFFTMTREDAWQLAGELLEQYAVSFVGIKKPRMPRKHSLEPTAKLAERVWIFIPSYLQK